LFLFIQNKSTTNFLEKKSSTHIEVSAA